MALKASTATKNAALNATGIKTQLAAGFLYVYSGAVPATADEALNMVTTHTELLKVSLSGGATGLTFDAPAAGVLPKAAAETWSGTCAFSGFDAATTQAPTFYRFCAAGDDGRAAANASTGYRIQGTAGGPSSGADLQFGTATLTDGNVQPIGAYSITLA